MRRREFVKYAGGAAVVWPLALHAQQRAMPVIGYLSLISRASGAGALAAFLEGLSEAGYVDGQNVKIEYRWADGDIDRLPALAADLVAQKVDVIVAAAGNGPALAAKQATSTTPIIFTSAGNPIEAGLVASYARPGGNLTGFTYSAAALEPKRLELLSELVPTARVIGLLIVPNAVSYERTIRDAEEAARAKQVQLVVLKTSSESEIDGAFASLVELHVGALLVYSDPFFTEHTKQLVALAGRYAVPAIYHLRGFVTAGGLISYGSRFRDFYRGAGAYVGRILAGAKPADLPVQQATTFELVVNLKTAKALGLTVPQSLLARADEVIE